LARQLDRRIGPARVIKRSRAPSEEGAVVEEVLIEVLLPQGTDLLLQQVLALPELDEAGAELGGLCPLLGLVARSQQEERP
jgi:hypothetical protein